MRKSHVPGGIVRLNGAAFQLDPEIIRAGNLETLVDAALSRVLGGTEELTCVQYNCNMYAPSAPPLNQ